MMPSRVHDDPRDHSQILNTQDMRAWHDEALPNPKK
jgi:hypothetical protein